METRNKEQKIASRTHQDGLEKDGEDEGRGRWRKPIFKSLWSKGVGEFENKEGRRTDIHDVKLFFVSAAWRWKCQD